MQGGIRSDHIYFVLMPGIDHFSITSQVGKSSAPSQMPIAHVPQSPRKEASRLRTLTMTLPPEASPIGGRFPAPDQLDRAAHLGGRHLHRHRTAS